MRARNEKGVALLVVLFIVMAVTVVSLGFLSRSDAELASGSNMLLNTRMRYLSDSALEHARGLLLNPQDISGDYWTGDTGLQLTSGYDYYDLSIAQAAGDYSTYTVNCTAYRSVSGEQTARMALAGVIRLDPCVGFHCNGNTEISPTTIVNGDVYVSGALYNRADINGDAYAGFYSYTGSVEGSAKSITAVSGITSPALNPASYTQTYSPDPNGEVELTGETLVFTSTFVVDGDLIVDGGSLVVTAPKNEPAMLLGGSLTLINNARISIIGYTQTDGDITTSLGTSLTIRGALHMTASANITGSGRVTITVDPMKAALRLSSSPAQNWSPASSAFYKSIARQ